MATTMHDALSPRLSELARFLKDRRARVKPDADTGRRRTPGLRREEVAAAAGISVAWYIHLEQGRDVKPSPHTIDRLSRVLRLNASERDYLQRLARPDFGGAGALSQAVSPALRALIDGLMPNPVYVLDRLWRVRACNGAAKVLFGDLEGGNLVVRLFHDEALRDCFADWPAVARSVVAQLRYSVAADPAMDAVVAGLCESSETFRTWWNEAEVSPPPVWRKTLLHRDAGLLTFDFAALGAGGADDGLTVCIHTPADAGTRETLQGLIDGVSPV